LMTSPLTLKTYVFFHSLWEKEIFDKQASSKNKFDHYLVEFDSCIVSDNEVYNNYLNISKNEDSLNLENLPTSFCGWWRLLEVDNRLVLPIKTRLRILVTSSDVLHSWAVPSLGVKIDACPGRLNCVYVYIKRPGVFHGQCSELCGVKHGFMPIVVHAVTRDKYNRWFADTCEFIN
jgi:heme/copper-type cytochrome/quinol oxidase subunit 2